MSFLNDGMNSHCKWRHLLKLCIGKRNMGDCKVSLIKLEIKFVKNSIIKYCLIRRFGRRSGEMNPH